MKGASSCSNRNEGLEELEKSSLSDNIFDKLPIELIRLILSTYCDGRSISTFLIAAVTSTTKRHVALTAIIGAIEDRFNDILIDLSGDNRSVIMSTFLPVLQQQSILEHPSDYYNPNYDKDTIVGISKRIGQCSVALSFLEENCFQTRSNSDDSDDALNCLPNEWPAWCGPICIHYAEYDSPRGRRIEEVNVIVTSTRLNPHSMQNWRQFMEQKQGFGSLSFSPEPRRFVPFAPFGRIRGVNRSDSSILSFISQQTTEHNEVLLPTSSFRSSEVLKEIRIISRLQAIDRLNEAGFHRRPANLSPLNYPQEESDLFAFWNDPDEDDLITATAFVDSMIHIMNTIESISGKVLK